MDEEVKFARGVFVEEMSAMNMSLTMDPGFAAVGPVERKQEVERLYESYRDRIYAFCLRMVGNPELAQDLTQDIFVKLLTLSENGLPDRDGKSVIGWLFTVAKNHCLDSLRRQKTWKGKLTLLMSQVRRSVAADAVENQVLHKHLGMQILSKMGEKQRSLLILKSCMGLSYQELADIFDTTPGTIGVLLTRARNQAIKIARDEGIDIAF
ncbi:MAG: sigma-70 family RNA polymerase sigma factor [Armatimonadetes bacterium]|nr:sigma-70 family RNA polymerase sigma factor [Armatimonadota bacterium]